METHPSAGGLVVTSVYAPPRVGGTRNLTAMQALKHPDAEHLEARRARAFALHNEEQPKGKFDEERLDRGGVCRQPWLYASARIRRTTPFSRPRGGTVAAVSVSAAPANSKTSVVKEAKVTVAAIVNNADAGGDNTWFTVSASQLGRAFLLSHIS
jgi:hypothetical protein